MNLRFNNLCSEVFLPTPVPTQPLTLGQLLKAKLADTSFSSNMEGKKEMNSPNVASILSLARKDTDLDLGSETQGLSEEIRKHLLEQIEQEKTNRAKEAAGHIHAALRLAKNHDENSVEQIRRARRDEKSAKNAIAVRARAQAYGMETNNFIPLLNVLGIYLGPNVEASLKEVPADWKPAEEQQQEYPKTV